MCGRYYIDTDDDAFRIIINRLGEPGQFHTGEIYPTNVVPVINTDGQPQLMKWGFPRYDGKGQIINARSETAAEKTMFRKPMQNGRCLIPATNYYEWQNIGSRKQKYTLKPEGSRIMYMAGISKPDESSELPLFVILTQEAADGIAFIHDRMPVILSRTFAYNWLQGAPPHEVFLNSEKYIAHTTAP